MRSDGGGGGRGSARSSPRPDPAPAEGGWGTHLNALRAGEGTQVLSDLLDRHPELAAEADAIARDFLSGFDFQQVAREVAEAIQDVPLEEIQGRAGRHEHGYVEPEEAAWEVLEEGLEPFHADVRRFLKAGLRDLARQVCMGIVLGLYRAAHEGKGPLLPYAPDFPAEAAGWAIEQWDLLVGRKGRRRRARRIGSDDVPLPAGFVEEWVPDWRTLLAPAVRKPGGAGKGNPPA